MRRSAVFFLVGVLAVLACGCGRQPSPPYSLSFALQVRPPRLLYTSQEVAVPVSVANTGRLAWDPDRVHLSYHWVWFIPRELASRSRTVPFHDGIRTELPIAVPPSGRIAVQGRVLAPSIPGFYWLQWDMVEEGVTWFAQVSPRQRRTLVVVVPPPAWVFAPLPLAIALAGVAAHRRRRVVDPGAPGEERGLEPGADARIANRAPPAPRASRFARWADVLWCSASLGAKPLVIVHEALLEPTAVAYWLIAVAAVVPPLLVALVVPRRLRAWLLVGVGVFGSLVILADVVYYRFFGDVFSTPALLAARQTGHVVGSIRTLVTPGLVWLIVDWPFAFWLVARMTRRRDGATTLAARVRVAAVAVVVLAATGEALSAPRVLASTRLDQMFRDRAVVEQLGPFGFHAYDGWNYLHARWLRPPVAEAQVREVTGLFAERAPGRAGGGPAFAVARGRNLIVVQVESLQDFAVDFTAAKQEVMPHLQRWVRDSVRFTNVTDQTSEGRTSDAEFATMTSLLPLDHGAVAFRYPGNHYVALPSVLREHGYHTLSAVAFEPGFWNRQVMHPAYGFDTSLFESDFQMTEQIGWGLNDRDFLQQAAARLERLPRPFVAWLITLSLHHPFEDFPAAHKTLALGALEGTSFGNYLHTMRFFDDALEAFKTTLARSGLLDDSVVVVFGDHDAGFARDAALEQTLGTAAAPAQPTDTLSNTVAADAAWVLNDRVPLFVRVPRRSELDPADAKRLEGVRSLPAGQTDFAPTILSLLGIDPAPLPFLGRNLLAAGDDRPVPRPYGDWLDAHHLFFTRGSERVCYDVARRLADTPESCGAADAAVRREREAARLVVTEDLQQRIREGLIHVR